MTSIFSLTLLALASVFQFAVAAPTIESRQLGVPIIPALDPFYNAPLGVQLARPGTVLRNRKVNPAFFGLVPAPVDAYQLLYRTEAVDGSAIAEVTTVFVPQNAKTDCFVSFQTAYDSSNTICNPSYNYQLGALQTDVISAVEQLVLQLYVSDGYIVSSSDYEGPDAAFAAGRLSGKGTLDSMRAVSNFHDTLGLKRNPDIVGIGYSGGGIATGWAAQLQPTYAPELPIRGWGSGGTPANLTGTAVFVDNTVFSGFLPVALDGLRKPSAYGRRLQSLYDRVLTPYGRGFLQFASNNCVVAAILAFADQSVLSKKFQTEGEQVLFDPTLRTVLDENLMGQRAIETPRAPVFLYHATDDEIIPYDNATTLRREWCDFGADVTFTTYASGGHLSTEVLGVVEQKRFVDSAFEGNAPRGCSMKTVLDNKLNPVALGAGLEPVLSSLVTALGNIGDEDSNVRSDPNNLKNTDGIKM